MKKIMLSLCAVGLLSMSVLAQNNTKMKKNYRAVPMNQAQIVQEGSAKMFCNVCGMTLPMFYKTNHAAVIDGKTHQYCSIHCAHEDAMKKQKVPTNMKVIDNTSLKFIDVNTAYYVVGSNKPATMSMVSKYAFASKKDAFNFASQFGGEIMKYSDLSKEVKEGLKSAMMMIQKKQHKMAMMGKKVYQKMCKSTDKRFETPALAKAYLKQNNLCGKLKGKPFQQVGLFLAGK